MKNPQDIRVIFFGTPEFGRITVEHLHKAGYQIAAVVTQPDEPVGRKKILTPSPVKTWAAANGIHVFQPSKLTPEVLTELMALQPDVFVVAAYGKIMRLPFLNATPTGAINVHGSLLPKYRGASPVMAAIAAGETETGVTIMQMDEGVDTGAMFATASCPIAADDTKGSLELKLAHLGGELLTNTLADIVSKKLEPKAQDESQATFTKLLSKETGRIDWNQPAEVIERHIRAMQPWPGAWTIWDNQPFKIISARMLSVREATKLKPGSVFLTDSNRMGVQCKGGGIEILLAQKAGKEPMQSAEIARGIRDLATLQF